MENEQTTTPASPTQAADATQSTEHQPLMYESLIAPDAELTPDPEIPFLANYQPHSFWD